MSRIDTLYKFGVENIQQNVDTYNHLKDGFAVQSQNSNPSGSAPLRLPTNCGARHSKSTKELAIEMRKKGCTYNEILAVVPVAKSTLSLWLREVGLSMKQKQTITEKRINGQKKAARVRHEMAVDKRNEIYDTSREQIGNLTDREIWLLATMAYWAEGAKERVGGKSASIDFANMDPRMIRMFVYWLTSVQKIPFAGIKFEIYIHENNRHRVDEVQRYWSSELCISVDRLQKVRFKKHKIKTNRKNTGILYNGLIRVKVVASSTLVRQLEGWAQGIDSVVKDKMSYIS